MNSIEFKEYFKDISQEHFETLEEPLRITAPKFVVAGDFHIPYYDKELLKEMINECKDRNIDTIILNGDFIDAKSLSLFLNLQQLKVTFQDEIREASKVFKLICNHFSNVYATSSNHELRFAKKLNGLASTRELYRLFSGIFEEGVDYFLSLYDYCYVGNNWLLCHPNFFSVVPLSIPRALSSKFRRNVICSHLHRLSLGKDVSGAYYAIEAGGLFDPDKLEYLRKTSKIPAQQSGYVIVENNTPILKPGKIEYL